MNIEDLAARIEKLEKVVFGNGGNLKLVTKKTKGVVGSIQTLIGENFFKNPRPSLKPIKHWFPRVFTMDASR